MISVAEALEKIREHRGHYGDESVELMTATGCMLAQDIVADRDFPPFDRVTMDGIAIAGKSFAAGRRVYKIEGVQPAGHPQKTLQDTANCIEVMTGAVLPLGCDTVIPYEDCQIEDHVASIQIDTITAGQNIHPKASDEKAEQLLVKAGTKITPSIIAIAATVGLEKIRIRRLPRMAICSTGDELVAIHTIPQDHQIRRSNSYMLSAALSNANITSTMYHLPDHPEEMKRQLVEMIPDYDVLLFSGAVSKGKFDYLPQVLDDLGMETVFHRVAQKPGKPLLFGKFKSGPVVFGFPGNPVSTLVCFQVFFKAWLYASLQIDPPALTARLATDFSFKPALSYHLPVTVTVENGCLWATPNAGSNSGDMVSLARTTAVITLPPDRQEFKKEEVFPLTWLQEPFV